MKKIVLTAAALALSASAAYAVPAATTTPGKIQGSKHDLSIGQTDAKSEICIYCHTPHNALINVPLWNRNNPSPGNFQLYKTSATLTTNTKNAGLTTGSISLFCMSCHDGATAFGDVANKNQISGTTLGNSMIQNSTGAVKAGTLQAATTENARLGTNLQNTHPVGFSFTGIPGSDSGIHDEQYIMDTFTNLKRAAGTGYEAATAPQYFLYGANSNLFECASCHRVHDPGTSGNFLRIENDKSQLCLACHNK